MEARFSTRATMEFLKSVPAVRGRLVTSVISCCPSGHMARRVGSELWTQAACPAALQEDSSHTSSATCKRHGLSVEPQAAQEGQTGASEGPSSQSPRALGNGAPSGIHMHAQRAGSPVVQQPLEVLEEGVSVLVNEALHRVPGGPGPVRRQGARPLPPGQPPSFLPLPCLLSFLSHKTCSLTSFFS